MKKLVVILLPLLLVSLLAAIDFDFDGENRTRAAAYNNAAERDGGHVDNRARLGINSELFDGLKFRALFEIGDIVWGGWGGALSTGAMNVETYELYIDYRIQAIEANVRVGQQYWADHRSLILDDSFSGILLSIDDMQGFQVEAAWMKLLERIFTNSDDMNYFMIHLKSKNPVDWGAYLMYGRDDLTDTGNITFMPHFTMAMDPLTVDIVPFADYQINPSPIDDEIGFGAAARLSADLDVIEAGVDALFATKNGLTVLSPYYQNGLYIYGYGYHHDGVNLYWNDGYSGNADTFLSLVGFAKAPVMDNLKVFAAGGLLLDTGFEVNAGVEYHVIPDIMTLSGYAAVGMHDNDTKNYLVGTTLQIYFP